MIELRTIEEANACEIRAVYIIREDGSCSYRNSSPRSSVVSTLSCYKLARYCISSKSARLTFEVANAANPSQA